MLKHLVLACAVALSGCALLQRKHTTTIKDVDWPLTNLQRLVTHVLPGGLRSASRNGREMYSHYFVPEKGVFTPAPEAKDRYFATITVLGDQRPYTVEIFVTHENRVQRDGISEIDLVGYSASFSAKLQRQFRQELAKRREDRNIIDDFRVF